MKVEVSIGEVIDKLSILELKMKKINDENKKIEIQKEINALQECHKYKEYYLYYNLLMYVNEKIWDMTDVIKSITIENPQFAYLSNQIFEFNQKRFRIKNWYNLITSSNIKEQKSYSLSNTTILINDINTFYNKISEIIYLALEYDVITIISNFNDKLASILKIPTIIYSAYDNVGNTCNCISLENFDMPDKNIIHMFEFKPIVYISGGMLGDFIHQLSVINENFLNTGRKGILYIASIGDNFRLGLHKAYEDTYQIITEQNYIKLYKIYNNETYDINLSQWRYNRLLFKTNWSNIFFDAYKVKWGKSKWIKMPYDNAFKDTILISNTSYRSAYNIDFTYIFEKYNTIVKFIDLSDEETRLFTSNFNGNKIELYKPANLYDLCVAINSCKLFIGNLSSPLTFAYAMHKISIVGLYKDAFSHDQTHNLGLDYIMPNLTINTDIDAVMEKIKLFCT
jgi:hypothetical protein